MSSPPRNTNLGRGGNQPIFTNGLPFCPICRNFLGIDNSRDPVTMFCHRCDYIYPLARHDYIVYPANLNPNPVHTNVGPPLSVPAYRAAYQGLWSTGPNNSDQVEADAQLAAELQDEENRKEGRSNNPELPESSTGRKNNKGGDKSGAKK